MKDLLERKIFMWRHIAINTVVKVVLLQYTGDTGTRVGSEHELARS